MQTLGTELSPFRLLDLELISFILAKLVAHEQGSCVQVCKLFAVILSELDRPYLSSACADSVADLKKAIAPKLVSAPSVGILFASCASRTSRADLGRFARSLPARMHLIGGASLTVVGVDPPDLAPPQAENDSESAFESQLRHAGVFCSQQGGQGCGIALTLAHFTEAEAGSFVVQESSLSVVEQLKEHGALDAGWKVFVVMVVGSLLRRHSIHAILQALQEAHPEAAIIGGLATGQWLARVHAHRSSFVRSGAVGLMFRGNVPLTALVCKGVAERRLKSAKATTVARVCSRFISPVSHIPCP